MQRKEKTFSLERGIIVQILARDIAAQGGAELRMQRHPTVQHQQPRAPNPNVSASPHPEKKTLK